MGAGKLSHKKTAGRASKGGEEGHRKTAEGHSGCGIGGGGGGRGHGLDVMRGSKGSAAAAACTWRARSALWVGAGAAQRGRLECRPAARPQSAQQMVKGKAMNSLWGRINRRRIGWVMQSERPGRQRAWQSQVANV
jgi:hypothetical protein